MRYLFTALGFVALLITTATLAFGEELVISWTKNPEPDIQGYRVYASDDLGQTWHQMKEVDANTTTVTIQVSEDRMWLFRVSVFDGSQENIRTDSGLWYNGLWKPLTRPKQIGVE